MFDIIKNEQEKVYDFIKKNHENDSFSHAYIIEEKNYDNLDLFLRFFVSNILDKECTNLDNNVDVCVIKPENGMIKKNQVDDLQKRFLIKSAFSDKKVYIMYGADKMNDVSANALLKFIEEPSDGIFGILITENRFRLLTTILSRCQIIRLKSKSLEKKDDISNIIFYLSNSSRVLNENNYDYVKDIMNKVLLFVDCYEKTGILSLTRTNLFFGKLVKLDIELFLDILILFYYDVIRLMSSFDTNIFNKSELLEYVKNNNTLESISNKIKTTILIKNKLRYNINGNLLIERLILLYEGRC